MIIAGNRNFLGEPMDFVHVPKTGGTSIVTALGIERGHYRASELQRPRFAFVRHPLDRLVSQFVFGTQNPAKKMEQYRMGATTLREFLLLPDNLLTAPQVYWIDAEVDFLGRFERLTEDFARISHRPLGHERKSIRGPWQDYFDPETLDMAVKRYRCDFDAFGYEIPEA